MLAAHSVLVHLLVDNLLPVGADIDFVVIGVFAVFCLVLVHALARVVGELIGALSGIIGGALLPILLFLLLLLLA